MMIAFSALLYPQVYQSPSLGLPFVFAVWGMACHDMAWPRPSVRWEWGACSSHLMCRQRAAHNRVAMRAAYLVLMALGEEKMSLQSLEDLLCRI